jgi:hypothetical protein
LQRAAVVEVDHLAITPLPDTPCSTAGLSHREQVVAGLVEDQGREVIGTALVEKVQARFGELAEGDGGGDTSK